MTEEEPLPRRDIKRVILCSLGIHDWRFQKEPMLWRCCRCAKDKVT